MSGCASAFVKKLKKMRGALVEWVRGAYVALWRGAAANGMVRLSGRVGCVLQDNERVGPGKVRVF